MKDRQPGNNGLPCLPRADDLDCIANPASAASDLAHHFGLAVRLPTTIRDRHGERLIRRFRASLNTALEYADQIVDDFFPLGLALQHAQRRCTHNDRVVGCAKTCWKSPGCR